MKNKKFNNNVETKDAYRAKKMAKLQNKKKRKK